MIAILVLLSATVPFADSVCVKLPETVKSGFYLQNNLFGVVKKPSLFDCAASCQAHIECHSFGFEPRKRLCHLHLLEEEGDPDELVPVNHWIHGNISALPLELWGPCADHNCTAGQKCTTNRVTKQAVCVEGDIDQAEVRCPVPPQLDNANISRGGQESGNQRTYTCLEGYLDTASSLNSSVSTCLPGFTWSRPNLTCSGPYTSIVVANGEELSSFVKLPDDGIRDVVKDNSLVFFCKSCSNCQVKLCNGQDDLDICVFVGITMTLVSITDNASGTTKEAVDLLSCSEFRPFWINWKDGIIAVGNGSIVGSQEFCTLGPLSLQGFNIVELGVIGIWRDSSWLLLNQN